MVKFIGLMVMTLACFIFALLPEIGMYFLWQVVSPTTEIMRLLLIGVFIFGGGALCVLFAFLGFSLWVYLLNELL